MNENYNNQNIGAIPPVETPQVTEEKKKKKSPVLYIILVLIILVFGVWAFLVYQDYGRVKSGEKPQYCWLGNYHNEYVKSDSYSGYEGTVDTCVGPGYKVIVYKTVAFKVTEFVPAWERTKTLDEVAEASK